MISVNVKFIDEKIKSLTVSGHANYDKYNKDIVCAGVSAVVTGGINSLESNINNVSIINEDNLLGVVVNNDNEFIQNVLFTIFTQLRTIENAYSKNIKISIEHGGV